MERGDRHKKITGDFGEHFLLYFLSKHSYETALIDYVGIDILATDKLNVGQRIGISVKSRSRTKERWEDGCTMKKNEYTKIITTCKYFDCQPWICFLFDRPEENKGKIYLFLMSVENVCKFYPRFKEGHEFQFSMKKKYMDQYKKNKEIYKIEFEYDAMNWTNFL